MSRIEYAYEFEGGEDFPFRQMPKYPRVNFEVSAEAQEVIDTRNIYTKLFLVSISPLLTDPSISRDDKSKHAADALKDFKIERIKQMRRDHTPRISAMEGMSMDWVNNFLLGQLKECPTKSPLLEGLKEAQSVTAGAVKLK